MIFTDLYQSLHTGEGTQLLGPLSLYGVVVSEVLRIVVQSVTPSRCVLLDESGNIAILRWQHIDRHRQRAQHALHHFCVPVESGRPRGPGLT